MKIGNHLHLDFEMVVAVVAVGRGGGRGWCNALRKHFSFGFKNIFCEGKIKLRSHKDLSRSNGSNSSK